MRPGYYDNMRVSDAERAEVADLLGRHYSDGRLDKQEFDERVARAMSAKTQGDLAGLFDDLPDLDSPAGEGPRGGLGGPGGIGGPGGLGGPGGIGGPGGLSGRAAPYGVRRHRGGHPVLLIVAACIAASLAWNVIAHVFFIPWFAIFVLVAIVMYAGRHARHPHR
jgi:hypothetical protein